MFSYQIFQYISSPVNFDSVQSSLLSSSANYYILQEKKNIS